MKNLTESYLEAALWTEEEELKKDLATFDFSPEAIAAAEKDCLKFVKENQKDIKLAQIDEKQIGHSLWLNRNGHGSGFWDIYSQTICQAYEKAQADAMLSRDFSKRNALIETCNCPYHACQRLSRAADNYGERYLYVANEKIEIA